MTFYGLSAYTKDHGICLFENFILVAEIAGFLGTTRSEVLGIEKVANPFALVSVVADFLEAVFAEADAGLKKAPYKMKNPGVYSMGGAFLMGILVSLFKREEEAEIKFEAEKVRTYIGIGAEGAASH